MSIHLGKGIQNSILSRDTAASQIGIVNEGEAELEEVFSVPNFFVPEGD